MVKKDERLHGYRIVKCMDEIIGKCYKIIKEKTGETVKKACDSPILRSIEGARRYIRRNLPRVRTAPNKVVHEILYVYGMEPDGSWIWDFLRNATKQQAYDAGKEWGWHDVHIAKTSDSLFYSYTLRGLTDPADLENEEEIVHEAV